MRAESLEPSVSRRRAGKVVRFVGFFALLVAATSVFTSTAPTMADPPPGLNDGAEVSASAVRSPDRLQLETPDPAPTYGGCLVGSVVTVSTSVDRQQRWRVGTVAGTLGRWKSALYATAGARGPVAVVGDSLTLAAITDTMRTLVDAGFGPVCIDGGVGRRIPSSTSPVSSGVQVAARIKASDPVWRMPEVRWVVALGTNDTRGFTYRYAGWIQTGLDAVSGTNWPVYWMNVRTLETNWNTIAEPAWNALLQRPGVRVIDWWTAIAATPELFIGSDLIHATSLGSALRAQLILTALTTTPT